MMEKEIDELFHPGSVAVVGVSDTEESPGYRYLRNTIESGFKGNLYPVHPGLKEVLGLKVYPSVEEISGDVDYVICCINASRVLDMMRQCESKNVKIIHFFTARMSETGDEQGRALEEQIAREAKRLGIRILGPNCMGLYYPEGGMTINKGLSTKGGPVGLVSQSGGLATDIVKKATERGVHFSKAVSYGNALDINESNLLDYFLWDENTRVIMIYIEGVRNGEDFYRSLRRAAGIKPVIILKGGRGMAGMKSAASHTASVAGSFNTWDVLFRQTGAIQAGSLEELIDLSVIFTLLLPFEGNRIGIMGGAGGRSVLSADECEESGLNVIPMPEFVTGFFEVKDPLAESGWLGNPVDRSILSAFNATQLDILRRMGEAPDFDVVLIDQTRDFTIFLNEEFSAGDAKKMENLETEIEECIRIYNEKIKPLAVVMGIPGLRLSQIEDWRWNLYFRTRERLIDAHVPLFSTVKQAASAIGKMAKYYQKAGGKKL